jgi:hypothetical protein
MTISELCVQPTNIFKELADSAKTGIGRSVGRPPTLKDERQEFLVYLIDEKPSLGVRGDNGMSYHPVF